MKNTSVLVALIIGIAIIVSSAMFSSAVKAFGRSLEVAAANQPRGWSLPSGFTLDLRLSDNGNPMRFEVSTKTKGQ